MIPLLKMVALLAGSHVVVHLNLMPEKHVAKYAARMQIVKVVNGAGLFMRTTAVLLTLAVEEVVLRKVLLWYVSRPNSEMICKTTKKD